MRVNRPDGYFFENNYPYYAYDGYVHRYSSEDLCNYELVDGINNVLVGQYGNMSCQSAYDSCSYERDRLNDQIQESRYFCSEGVNGEQDYNWNANDDFYSDIGNDFAEDDWD